MCYHRRILCTCNHTVWLARVGPPCEDEKAWVAGATGEPCMLRQPHALATVRVERECDGCVLARKRTSGAISAVRLTLGSIRETLERALGGSSETTSLAGESGEEITEGEDITKGEKKEKKEKNGSTPGRRASGRQQLLDGGSIETTMIDAETLMGRLEKERLQKEKELLERKENDKTGKEGQDVDDAETDETMEMIETYIY